MEAALAVLQAAADNGLLVVFASVTNVVTAILLVRAGRRFEKAIEQVEMDHALLALRPSASAPPWEA